MLLIFLILFSSYETSQNHTSHDGCAENEHLGNLGEDHFCCNVDEEGGTMVEIGTVFLRGHIAYYYLAPNVCTYAKRLSSYNNGCNCNLGSDFVIKNQNFESNQGK